MFIQTKGCVRVLEEYFEVPHVLPGADLARYHQLSSPLAHAFCSEFYTMVIPLQDPEDVLFSRLKKDTRTEIRRSARQGVLHEIVRSADPSALQDFCRFYDRCASDGGLPPINRARLSSICMSGSLDLSYASDASHQRLTYHCYYRTARRARLLHVASMHRGVTEAELRSLIGRAHRYHHWRDILAYRTSGLCTYDFGGWYPGSEDRHLLTINTFKAEFGGAIIREYNCLRAETLLGKTALLAYRLLNLAPRSGFST